MGGSLCLIALLAGAGLTFVAQDERIKLPAAVVGTLIVAFALAMAIVHLIRPSIPEVFVSTVANFVCLLVVIPACAIAERQAAFQRPARKGALSLRAAEAVIVGFLQWQHGSVGELRDSGNRLRGDLDGSGTLAGVL